MATWTLDLAQVTQETGRWINLNLDRLVPFLFNLLGALGIFIVAWIAASLLAEFGRSTLKRTGIDDRLSQLVSGTSEPTISVGKWLGLIVFWVVLLLGVVGALDVLQLSGISQPLAQLLNEIFAYVPRIIGGLIVAVLAWGVATVTKLVVVRLSQSLQLDQPLELPRPTPEAPPVTVGELVGTVLYWLVWLFFLPLILDTLQLQGPLQPVQNLVNELLAALPRIFKAVLIGLVGWLVARVLRTMTVNLLTTLGADPLGQRLGLGEQVRVSQVGGGLVYILVWIPTIVAALEALEIQAISRPAVAMLNMFLMALPRVFTAGLILLAAYVGGRLLGEMITGVLTRAGFDQVLTWLGLPAPAQMQQTPSQVAGFIVLGGVMQLGVIAAVEVLEIPTLTAVATGLLVIFGQVLVGLLVLAVGIYAANAMFRLIAQAGTPQARFLAQGARIATLALVGAMALRQMGIAADIVNLAFGLLFGAIAVAIAIAFGLGGQQVVAQQLQEWRDQMKNPPQ
ncbi:MAG: mechanosensitive ion channel [Gloeomargarita sp. SZTDM-1c_bins_89]